MAVMAPGDASDLPAMLDWALQFDGPTAIRYPKASAVTIERESSPVALGRSILGGNGIVTDYGMAKIFADAEAISRFETGDRVFHQKVGNGNVSGIDGNKLTSTDHRLKPLRKTKSGPLPGMALAVLDPERLLHNFYLSAGLEPKVAKMQRGFYRSLPLTPGATLTWRASSGMATKNVMPCVCWVGPSLNAAAGREIDQAVAKQPRGRVYQINRARAGA